MNWLQDLSLFFTIPLIAILCGVLFYRSCEPKRYKIVREFNQLGEERFEVWFDYPASPLVKHTWCLRETFNTLELAEDYIARQHSQRETVREGSL